MIITDPNHKHIYDAQGKMICCTLEDKIYEKAGAENLLHQMQKTVNENGGDEQKNKYEIERQYLPVIISLAMLLIGIATDYYFKPAFFTGYTRFAWYAIAYLPVGLPVMKEGWEVILKKEIFTEFTLMVLATIGHSLLANIPKA